MSRVSVKVCGLTRPADARRAVELGADYGGVIGHPGSPRFVEPGSVPEAAVLGALPPGSAVWVEVEPEPEAVAAALGRGFGYAQVHFDPGGAYDPAILADRVGPARIWLAPRLRDPADFDPAWQGLAVNFLVDAFAPDRFGGTGHRVDGPAFAALRAGHPDLVFTLAGGLSPENVREAVAASGADRIDVNSGVESAPGEKDHARLERLFARLVP